jgi:predicted ATPase
MIDSVRIENFKCFEALRLRLGALTLLTGYNGGGKSSFIQPLLLLSQALNGQATHEIPLNGSLTRLGTRADVMSGGDPSCEVISSSDRIRWRFGRFDGVMGERLLKIRCADAALQSDEGLQQSEWTDTHLPFGDGSKFDPVWRSSVVRTLRNMVAISATRLGTLDVQPMPSTASFIRGDVGNEGQFASFWYDELVDEVIGPKVRIPGSAGQTMRSQVDAYLSRLFPGAGANVTALQEAGAYALRFRIGTEDWRRPANVGYGLTYAFPIVVALLAAGPGQLIVIDSPEAHLHPSAQSQMGVLLARVASSGVQLLIETHSDHLLNGVRLAVKDPGVGIKANDVALHFFSGVKPEGHGVKSLRIDSDGNISDWPAGFFDQNEVDLARLAGWV